MRRSKMSKKTSDTNSDIDDQPEKLFTPGFEKDGSKGPDLVEIGIHDISKDAKQTIGDFLSRVTKGKAGSAGKPNAYAVDHNLQDMALTDPSTGLPAPHGNQQGNQGSSDSIKSTGTTVGSFLNTVDSDARAKFDNLSAGDFNNAEGVPGLASKEDKNGQKFGHTVYSDIESVKAPSNRLGAPPVYAPKGSDVQKKISAVLTSNRFNPTPNTPFMQENAPNEMGFTKQTEMGKYIPNQEMVPFGELKKVGHQMVVAATGHEPDLESMVIAGILPTVEQITGLQIIDSQDLRPRSMPASAKITENKGELVLGESNNKSHGQLTSPLEPFAQAMPVGMLVNTIAGMATVILSAGVLSEILMLFKPDGATGSGIKPSEPHKLKKGRHALKKGSPGGMLWDLLNVPTVEYPFDECMYLGILTFYGITKLPVGDFDLSKLIDSAKVVAGSPGYYGVITRNVIRDADQIAEAVSGIPMGPDAVIQIFNIVEALTNSSTWRFLMQMAKLGNQVRMGIEDHPRLDADDPDRYRENAASRVSMSRANPSFGGPMYPGSQKGSRLAWRHSASPSRYILPMSFIRASANSERNNSNKLTKGLAMAIDGEPYVRDKEGSLSNLGDGRTFTSTAPKSEGIKSRLSGEYVEYVENSLEAEYMPFYFHDLRTNEIISFHAFLGSYTDGFSTDYTSTAGYGRPDEVKIFNKTTRTISFDFTIAATSAEDLDVMYWNVNKLVSMCYPQWSRGRKMTNGDGDKFIQPFSQIPTASPMIRVRLGDMMKSNYSKFGLQRAFGLGNSASEFNIDQKTDEEAKRKKDVASARAAISKLAEKIFWSKQVIGVIDPSVSGTGDGDMISSLQGGTTPSPEPEFGYAVGDFVKLDPTPTKYWPRTSDGKMGKEQNPSVGPEAKEGRLHKYSTPVEVEIVKRVPGQKNSPSGFDSALQEAEDNPSIDPGTGELAYLVKLAVGDAAHDHIKPIDESFLHHRAEHSEIIGLSEKGEQRILDALLKKKLDEMGAVPPDVAGIDRLNAFFDSKKNFIVRSFESSRGRGLAGFITGLNFDWAESTWEIEPGRRAPKMIKLSVSFAPVHDLHMGLDHDGMMTSVPFNVGELSNAIGGDPYDEKFAPSSDKASGAKVKAAADGKSKPAAKSKDPSLNAAKKLANPFPF